MVNPPRDAIKRWVCSKKIPPTQRENGNKNMLYPKVVGQSGTASPTPLLVTMPPLQTRSNVAHAVNQTNRLSQRDGAVLLIRIGAKRRSQIRARAEPGLFAKRLASAAGERLAAGPNQATC